MNPSARAIELAQQWIKIFAPFRYEVAVIESLAQLLDTAHAAGVESWPPAPAAPTVTHLDPATAAVGTTFTLHVYGTSFTAESGILWDGLEVSTTYVAASELTTAVALGLEGAARPVAIEVETKTLPRSNALTLMVTLPGTQARSVRTPAERPDVPEARAC